MQLYMEFNESVIDGCKFGAARLLKSSIYQFDLGYMYTVGLDTNRCLEVWNTWVHKIKYFE